MMLTRGRAGGAMIVGAGPGAADDDFAAVFVASGDRVGAGRGTDAGGLASSCTPTGASDASLGVAAVDDDSDGASAAATVNESGSAGGPEVPSDAES